MMDRLKSDCQQLHQTVWIGWCTVHCHKAQKHLFQWKIQVYIKSHPWNRGEIFQAESILQFAPEHRSSIIFHLILTSGLKLLLVT